MIANIHIDIDIQEAFNALSKYEKGRIYYQ